MNIVGVRFKRAGKVYHFRADGLELAPGEQVIVETERGMAIGTIVDAEDKPAADVKGGLKSVLRRAQDKDRETLEANEELGREARAVCQELIDEKNLPMKLLEVETLFDRSKVIFFFVSEGRVDFRELVRDLARRFHTRIEMRQVGVRDEAKIVGGLGCCGRELCCATWLSDFAPISVRMAKSQNLSLNPAKISGVCGRLMCCLAYEHKMYEQMSRGMPKVGKRVETVRGEGKVIRRNALDGTFTVNINGREVELDVDEHKKFLAGEIEAMPPEEPTPVRERRPRREPRERIARDEGRGEEQTADSAEEAEEGAGADKPQGAKRGARRGRGRRSGAPQGQSHDQSPPQTAGGETPKEAEGGEAKPNRTRRRRRRKPSAGREKKDNE